jgi:DNA-binding MarR family transcriptional regulator
MRTISLDSREQLVGQVLVEVGALLRDLRCAMADRFAVHGLSMSQFHVLGQLERQGAISMSRIADLLDVSMPNASGLVDRMVERGLVERVGDPDDRRVVLVRLLPAGLTALEAAEGIKLDGIRTVCGHLDDEQLGRISAAIGDLRGAIAQEFPTQGKGRN